MDLIKSGLEAARWSASMRKQGRSIGFVPTMGALHEGHLQLVREAASHTSVVVASIFVNPLQFNNKEDLLHYPRQVEKDLAMLEGAHCHMAFVPDENEIFRGHRTQSYDLGGLDNVLEGPSRPGHFQGVVNVVERLFHFIRPDKAFFGEKDRQQLTVIQHVAAKQRWPETIVPVATVRASDGLALSSRNQRLSPEERLIANTLYSALRTVAEHVNNLAPSEARAAGVALLKTHPSIELDYLEITDPTTLQPFTESWKGAHRVLVLVAARVGPVRLIDNIEVSRTAEKARAIAPPPVP